MSGRFAIPPAEVERFDPVDLRRYLTEPAFRAKSDAERARHQERNNILIDIARLRWAESRGIDHWWVEETRQRVAAYARREREEQMMRDAGIDETEITEVMARAANA